MPKYFSDEKALRYTLFSITTAQINSKIIDDAFYKSNQLSISIVPDGLHSSSLGYVVHIKKINDTYLISNIVDENELSATDTDSLCTVLKHICGHEYSKHVQQIFQKNRNNIGSTANSDFFTNVN